MRDHTVLVIAPHPDDEVLGCGGVVARHAANGDEVHVVIVTRGIPELFASSHVEKAREEARAASELLGVSNLRFLDFPAPRLNVVANHELADCIRAIINATQPSTVYMPHHGDLHADHRAVHRATLVAARPLSACPVLKLLSYECPSETEWGSSEYCFIPTVFVDISSYLQSKQKALACYQSQLEAPPHSRSLQTIEHLARLRRSTISVDAAEAFVLVREILK